ncbi:MAG: ABC transporter permease [Firmicutes bacterium]|nr:ABC transporter permease [Candidatus Fermentithermobacillaceae bacterium]
MFHAFAEAWKGLRRNGLSSFLSLLTTFIALSLVGATFLVEANLKYMFKTVEQGMDVQAFLKKGISPAEVDGILAAVKKIPGVRDVTYVSPEDGLKELREMFQDMASVLDGLEANNPLPPKIEVKTTGVEQIVSVASALREIAGVEDVIYQKEAQKKLEAIGRVLQMAGLAGVISMGAVSVLVIGNSIRLTIFARRHEVAIMKLVGATDGFITAPFFCEGLLLGFFGALAASGMLIGVYYWLSRWLAATLPYLPVLPLDSDLTADILTILVITGLAVGGFGSALSLRKYLT